MKEVATCLLDVKAVTLRPQEPFIWASGIKSPIYCDNRLILSYPKERKMVLKAMEELIKKEFPDVEYIMGTATAGIPHASIVAHEMDLPTGFVRSKAKDHGKGKQVEGEIIPGAKTVVVEDLFSTGGSSIEAAKAVAAAGFEVLGIVSIFTYAMDKAERNFAEGGFKHASLTDFPELVEVAVERGDIPREAVASLEKWRKNPDDESWIK